MYKEDEVVKILISLIVLICPVCPGFSCAKELCFAVKPMGIDVQEHNIHRSRKSYLYYFYRYIFNRKNSRRFSIENRLFCCGICCL